MLGVRRFDGRVGCRVPRRQSGVPVTPRQPRDARRPHEPPSSFHEHLSVQCNEPREFGAARYTTCAISPRMPYRLCTESINFPTTRVPIADPPAPTPPPGPPRDPRRRPHTPKHTPNSNRKLYAFRAPTRQLS